MMKELSKKEILKRFMITLFQDNNTFSGAADGYAMIGVVTKDVIEPDDQGWTESGIEESIPEIEIRLVDVIGFLRDYINKDFIIVDFCNLRPVIKFIDKEDKNE